MRPKDVRECVAVVAAHPIAGPRYGNSLEDLRKAWLRLLSSNGFCSAMMFEEIADGAASARPRIVGVGVTVFVSDSFVRELKTRPFFWFGPEMARRVARGDSPVFSEKQVREANSRGGLNLAVWHCCVPVRDLKRAEVWQELMNVFLDEHRGYLLKELVAQGESLEHLEGIRNTSMGPFYCTDGCYGDFGETNLEELLAEPHIVGITGELARGLLISWIGLIFVYEAPQFGFSRSEQRLLLSALAGGTDEELSNELGVSLSAIKQTWRSIYRRVVTRNPELIPSDSQEGREGSTRGRNKKQHLIAYLREHRQELRPVSRKILQQNAVRLQEPGT